jgi:hypothetical protein
MREELGSIVEAALPWYIGIGAVIALIFVTHPRVGREFPGIINRTVVAFAIFYIWPVILVNGIRKLLDKGEYR